ncbi:exodeoxyribonuclease III [Dechloromonas sp.]|uniref:exodeoxyribonuclease III n=1 Tax=Dechloromonas sp. TaxID=1917218 RepID=UPI00122868AD|nr:exodeoxyribonuclease III [Dechloromonas sp.]MBU3695126.1 exodeoxyribonuclease III [Dechloromonas sp.]TEX47632.1 MAG: exodeoxyribonuclease III [Rhodocyclaceae bacterium]
MRIISANLNGIRSANTKGFFEWLKTTDADVVCVQELKAQAPDLTNEMRNPASYKGFFHYAEKKGYSGVGIYCRREPERIVEGIGHAGFDAEGRFIRADFGDLSVISVYVPSGSSSPERQVAKFQFLDEFMPVMDALKAEGRECVVCGDWNIAHSPIDLKNWRGNQKNSGFLPEERDWLTRLYASGWTDVYRKLYPAAGDEGYTWWSNRGQAYAKNVGWRIDLHVATAGVAAQAREGNVYKGKKFSDHAPLIVDYAGRQNV